MKAKCIIFDIDGTIANIEHRRHHVINKPKNWGAFEEEKVNDTPNEDIIFLLKTLYAAGCTIVLASGRSERERQDTINFLYVHGVPYDKFYMRKEKDNRSDDIVKEEILAQMRADGYEPYMVFDDRQRVVDMWRRNGIRCLQVDSGDF